MHADPVDIAIHVARAKLAHLENREGEMQRDMELVREVLRTIKNKEDLTPREITISGYPEEVARRHVAMLYDEGYIDGSHQDMIDDGRHVFVIDLSWRGHEFAGALLADETVWSKVKASLGPEKLATLPLKFIETVAMDALSAWVKSNIGLN